SSSASGAIAGTNRDIAFLDAPVWGDRCTRRKGRWGFVRQSADDTLRPRKTPEMGPPESQSDAGTHKLDRVAGCKPRPPSSARGLRRRLPNDIACPRPAPGGSVPWGRGQRRKRSSATARK